MDWRRQRWVGRLHCTFYIVKQFDEKYRIWDKAVEIDQKYKIQEKVQNAAQSALQSAPGQKAKGLAEQTYAQIAAVHYEATKIKEEKGGDKQQAEGEKKEASA